jgi:hypothetical protein
MVDNNHVLAVIAFLVLVSVLAILVAWARASARRKPLPSGGVLAARSRPGRQLFQGGMDEGVHGAALAAATTAAAAAASVAVSAFDGLAAAAPEGPAALAAAATTAAAAASAAVPAFNNLATVAGVAAALPPAAPPAEVAAATTPSAGPASLAVAPQPAAATTTSSEPKDVMFGINPAPQTFKLVGRAGSGGTKRVSYIDQNFGDWVLALPTSKGGEGEWPRMVSEELNMTAQLHALGIPCLEMYGVMWKPPVAGTYEGLALKMRSFDYYRNTRKTVIFDCNSHDASHQFMTTDKWCEIINGEADKWLAHGIPYATDKLLALLAPLAEDIKTLAQSCGPLQNDSRSWQVVFSDGELKIPLQVRAFIFDLTSKDYDRPSILADAGESASAKSMRARAYLTHYLGSILPYGEAYKELNAMTRARMEELLPAAPAAPAASATEGLIRRINMGGSENDYYAVRTGLPATDGFNPDAMTYFVFERVCPQNIEFWTKYVEAQNKSAVRDKNPISKDTSAVLRALELFPKQCSDKFDVWIAYVSSEMPTVFADRGRFNYVGGPADNTGIEMAVSVLVHRETPITTHTGIFRTLKHWVPVIGDEKKQYIKTNYTDKGLSAPWGVKPPPKPVGHYGLSTLCHAFAASAAITAYRHLGYIGVMVTRSASKMGKELIKGLKQGDYIVGSPDERSQEKLDIRAEWAETTAEYPNEDEDHEDYLPEVYEPALGVQYTPFFAAGVDEATGAHTLTSTRTDHVYKEPEWLQLEHPCNYKFDSGGEAKHATLEYTIKLDALERSWWAGVRK